MGKKNKQIFDTKLSEEELVPSTIGVLEEERKSTGLLIVYFAIFIVFALFLPTISGYITSLMEKDDTPVAVEPEGNENQTPEVKEKDVMYAYKEDLSFTIDGLEISNFVVDSANSQVVFNIKNTNKELVDFATKKYFMEIYDSSKKLLGRHIFDNYNLTPNGELKEKININDSEVSGIANIMVVQKTENDYPEVAHTTDGSGYDLNCSNGIETIQYRYDSREQLTLITDIIRYNRDSSSDYASSLTTNTARAATYNNKDGVASNLIEISTGYIMTTEIDMDKANVATLNNANYYGSDTKVKVISFEMESRGYSCK